MIKGPADQQKGRAAVQVDPSLPITYKQEDWLTEYLIQRAETGLHLEYKSSSALGARYERSQIARDVSAFANADGGRIIYGVSNDQARPGIIEGIDAGQFSADWLAAVVNTEIMPPIRGVSITAVALGGGLFVYVVDVPRASADAPHMASDHKYYRRHGRSNIPMHDYEVRNALRLRKPHLDLWFSWDEFPSLDGGPPAPYIGCFVENLSDEPALYTRIHVELDQRILAEAPVIDFGTPKQSSRVDALGHKWSSWALTRFMVTPSHLPLFSGQEWLIFHLPLSRASVKTFEIAFEIACPGFSDAFGGTVLVAGPDINPMCEQRPSLFR